MTKKPAKHYVVKQIENTMLELLSYKQYNDITIKEIIINANISRSSFYRHYNSVNDVIHSIIDDLDKTLISLVLKDHSDENNVQNLIDFLYVNKTKYLILYQNNLFNISLTKMCNRVLKNADDNFSKYRNFIFIHSFYALIELWLYKGCVESSQEFKEIFYRLILDNVSKTSYTPPILK